MRGVFVFPPGKGICRLRLSALNTDVGRFPQSEIVWLRRLPVTRR
jgi:hypothetical protein